ncbi:MULTISPECIES: pyruvate formate-lyase [Solibacillus]|uniref:Pyruvate formate-lyase n=1 Tax=Solibacillus merdavium TaxID=2762218 RepID=A0ABR8XNE8_9BACL|nr:pyruvate formate-lyase [Solibacillus merdavium]MBD8033462.1 pyruvate formate-lyase [Solibacillus merdavium]
MIALFASVIYLVLFLFLKQTMDKLHSIIVVIAFFIFFQFIIREQLIPLWQRLAVIFNSVPYSKGLLFTALLFLMNELICQLLEQYEYDAFATLVTLSIRMTAVLYWINLLQPKFQVLIQLLERLQ